MQSLQRSFCWINRHFLNCWVTFLAVPITRFSEHRLTKWRPETSDGWDGGMEGFLHGKAGWNGYRSTPKGIGNNIRFGKLQECDGSCTQKKQLSTASRDLSLFALCSTPHPLPTSKRWFSNSEKCSLNLYIILGGLRVIRFLWRGSIVPQPRQMDQGSNITLMYHNKMLCIPCSPGVIFWGMVQLYNYKMHVQSISDTCSFHQILNGSLCKSDATNW